MQKKFTERKGFHPLINWGIGATLSAVLLYHIITIVTDEFKPESLIAPVFLLAGVLFFMLIKLDFSIDSETISYKMFPLEFKTKVISKAEIESMTIIHPKWYEYGGYGKRRRLISKKIAYRMDNGPMLEVTLKNGKIRAFSIKNTTQLKRLLAEHYNQLYT